MFNYVSSILLLRYTTTNFCHSSPSLIVHFLFTYTNHLNLILFSTEVTHTLSPISMLLIFSLGIFTHLSQHFQSMLLASFVWMWEFLTINTPLYTTHLSFCNTFLSYNTLDVSIHFIRSAPTQCTISSSLMLKYFYRGRILFCTYFPCFYGYHTINNNKILFPYKIIITFLLQRHVH